MVSVAMSPPHPWTQPRLVSARRRDDAIARLWTGALAGVLATAAMTAVLRRGRDFLPPAERYSLPPTELTQAAIPSHDPEHLGDRALLAHFAYGALCGGALALAGRPRTASSASLSGLAIWAGSYLGWAPALGLLKPATRHPWRRNLLMLLSHLVWGLGFQLVRTEIHAARQAFAAQGRSADRVS
jgi:hypothetical protein